MNFSSPHGLTRSGTVPSLIQETKVLARSPAGFFLPAIHGAGCASPSTVKLGLTLGDAVFNKGCSKTARP